MVEERVSGEAILPGCDLPAATKTPQGSETKKPRLRPINRSQMILHPVDIERLVPEDHEVRAIWELVGSLDLSCYYDHVDSVEGNAGAPVSLSVSGSTPTVKESARPARLPACQSTILPITGMRPVNYHTLADFRSTNDSLRELFVEVLAMLTKEGLVTMERVMHDGTRIKACAGRDTFRKEETIRDHLMRASTQVLAMEEASEEEIAPRIMKAKERAVKERKERLSHALNELG